MKLPESYDSWKNRRDKWTSLLATERAPSKFFLIRISLIQSAGLTYLRGYPIVDNVIEKMESRFALLNKSNVNLVQRRPWILWRRRLLLYDRFFPLSRTLREEEEEGEEDNFKLKPGVIDYDEFWLGQFFGTLWRFSLRFLRGNHSFRIGCACLCRFCLCRYV